MSECIFCKIVQGKKKVETILYENRNFLSIPDANPVVKGHSLVISKKHFPTILDMPNTVGSELIDCIKNTAIKIMKEQNADGFNVVNNNFESAGQVVDHIHFHIHPRRKDDGVNFDRIVKG